MLVLSACTQAGANSELGDDRTLDADASTQGPCATTLCGEAFECVEVRGLAQCIERTEMSPSEDPEREGEDASIAEPDAEVFESMGPTYPADGFCAEGGDWAFCEDFDGQGMSGREDFVDSLGLVHNAHSLSGPELDCKSTISDTSVPTEYRNCRPYLEGGVLHTVGEHGGFGISVVRVEQPLDFAGREGHIHIESELTGPSGTFGRKTWGIALSPIATVTMPDARVVFEQTFAPDPIMLISAGPDGLQPLKIAHYRNGVEHTQFVGPGPLGLRSGVIPIDIYVTRNHVRIVLDGTQVVDTDTDDLGFERAYLYLTQLAYNPNKAGVIGAVANTFLWDNVAFDVPVLPRNALTPMDQRDVSFLAHSMESCRVRGIAAAGPARAQWGMWQEWRVRVPANSAPVTQADIDCTLISDSPYREDRFLEIHSVERQ